jgi:aminomethyltransferase
MCYENGTVVDDEIYYMENENKFRIIVNASNIDQDFRWLNEHTGEFNVKISDISKNRCRLAFQGPNSDKLLDPLVNTELSQLKRFYFTHCNLDQVPLFIARTGYTGESGFEISMDAQYSEIVWNKLLKTGASPVGLGARDTLRLEACYSLYGHEISDTITPIEANLGWTVKEKKGIDYIGKQVLLNQKKTGTSRTLVGLNLIDRGILRENYKIFKNGENVGYITSGGYSPTLKKTIGLALVRADLSSISNTLEVKIRDKLLNAIVVSTPFYRNV